MIEQTVKNAATDAKKLLVDGVEYYRYNGADAVEEGEQTDGIFLGPINGFALQANRKLSIDEIHRAVKILSFFWKSNVRGNESLTTWNHFDDEIILIQQKLTEDGPTSALARNGNARVRFAQLVLELNAKMTEGTPLRKHGTRAEDGISKPVEFTVWVDEVEQTKKVQERPSTLAKVLAHPAPPVIVEEELPVPAWGPEPEDFFTKEVGDLTFNEVSELLEALKTSHQRTKDLETENEKLRETISEIKVLLT